MKSIQVKPNIYPRHDGFDATVHVEFIDYSSSEKPEMLHKYVKTGFFSRQLAEEFAYNECLRIEDVMLTACREYLKQYKDAQ